ncbi:hypothetical protein ASG60_08030 [Methylobacterium sp. Leaf469]|uniref:hypothetical protein n=1 Tax=Methylobacterium sp. Leaf469 TaxID=1736387 RepID=UPI0006FA3C82|nr:hypothetical protein [Methylobacterium sp. Leaf469]KQT93312.1 hypothetical protein ASG60_08030 [Methylobacterium sp. Leaf469]
MALPALRSLRESVETSVLDEAVDGTLAVGVYAYISALVRLVEDGDRAPDIALAEGSAAVAFLRAVPRLPPARPRPWRPS